MNITRFAPLFSDYCVLQRRKPIRIWGTGEDGAKLEITLSADDGSYSFTQEAQIMLHQFSVTMNELEAGGPYTLSLKCDGQLLQECREVMIGEVWLAGGQSNMEYELKNDGDARVFFADIQEHSTSGQLKGSVSSADTGSETAAPTPLADKNIRYYHVNRISVMDSYFYHKEAESGWITTDAPELGQMTAVGYYFAKELAQRLQITVGIIGCNWGGTSACAWQSREMLLSSPETSIYWQEYEELVSKQSLAEYEKELKEYQLYQVTWQQKIDQYYSTATNPSWDEALAFAGECKWPGPMGPYHEYRPCGLYETMLLRVAPYTLGGFIYYQGESDDHRPHSYYTLLKNMIADWRQCFMDTTIPFINVQLPMHHYEGETPSDKWCYIREAQMKLHEDHICEGLAVIIDLGEFNNIHPIYKKEVGRRLALQALHHVYHMLPREAAYGPAFEAADWLEETKELVLTFTNASEFIIDGSLPCGFEFTYDGETFHEAFISYSRDNCIALCSTEMQEMPKSIRYLWRGYCPVAIWNEKKLPLPPFRAGLEPLS